MILILEYCEVDFYFVYIDQALESSMSLNRQLHLNQSILCTRNEFQFKEIRFANLISIFLVPCLISANLISIFEKNFKKRHENLSRQPSRKFAYYTLHLPLPVRATGFSAGFFPVHSPLLRESSLFSFPPLTDMLKFSG
jgi:hypothetical protein